MRFAFATGWRTDRSNGATSIGERAVFNWMLTRPRTARRARSRSRTTSSRSSKHNPRLTRSEAKGRASRSRPTSDLAGTLGQTGDSGEPGRNRTFNQQIKSLLLCQLSYGPTRVRPAWAPAHRSRSRMAGATTRLANPNYTIRPSLAATIGRPGRRPETSSEAEWTGRCTEPVTAPCRAHRSALRLARRRRPVRCRILATAADRVRRSWQPSVERWQLLGRPDEPGLCRSVARVRLGCP